MKGRIKVFTGRYAGYYYLAPGDGCTKRQADAHIYDKDDEFVEDVTGKGTSTSVQFIPLEEETSMYTPSSDSNGVPNKKMWLVWRVRNNSVQPIVCEHRSWLTKEDCPSTIHSTYESAMKEADRLTERTGHIFAVFEAVAILTKKEQPRPEYRNNVRLLTAH